MHLIIPQELVPEIVQMFQRFYPKQTLITPSFKHGGEYETESNDGFLVFSESYHSERQYLRDSNSPYSLKWFLNLQNYGRCQTCQLGDYVSGYDSYIAIVAGYQPAENYDEHSDHRDKIFVFADNVPEPMERHIIRGIFTLISNSNNPRLREYYNAVSPGCYKDLWPILSPV